MATTAHRPRISKQFLQENQQRRILDALAGCVVEDGYPNVTVADVVREAGIAKNTFYVNFGSKEDAAEALVADLTGDRQDVFPLAFQLAVDLASALRAGRRELAVLTVSSAQVLLSDEARLDPMEESDGPIDPLLSSLPPGRHGLDDDFVRENQRRRLILGTAQAVWANGYRATTIADITRLATVSRRTFYEHFAGKLQAVGAMVRLAGEQSGVRLAAPDFDRGFDQLWAEIVAAEFSGDRDGAEERRKAGLELVERCRALLGEES